MVRISRVACRGVFVIAVLGLTMGIALRADNAPKRDAPKPGEPTDSKARKTFASAIDSETHRDRRAAIDAFRKANKQDGGQCWECLRRAYGLAIDIGEFKDAEEIAHEWLALAQNDSEKASIHYEHAAALQRQGIADKKDKCFSESCDEFKTALDLEPRLTAVHFSRGISLAYLHRDDEARAEFAAFLDQDRKNPDLHLRAERYKERVELARARMAPAFSAIALDGQHISMDSLAGKVVLIDFWATWCGPCREALPHIKKIATKFDGQPLVVLSISLDSDEAKWRDFVAKNGMTWSQYRDGGFEGSIAKQFGVTAIPATFSIDADGVIEDQHVGDEGIEGKLKKMIARAVEAASSKSAPADKTLSSSN